LIESVTTTDLICEIDQVSIITSAERVVEAYEAAPGMVKSIKKFFILFSFVQSALAAANVLEAAANPDRTCSKMKRAASAAERAVQPVDALDTKAAISAVEAARQDYEILLAAYGKHDEVIIGKPVDCFKAKE
jgi:hypothetical protein